MTILQILRDILEISPEDIKKNMREMWKDSRPRGKGNRAQRRIVASTEMPEHFHSVSQLRQWVEQRERAAKAIVTKAGASPK